MVNYLTKLINFKESIAEDFTQSERVYISVGFKNYMGGFLSQSRIVNAIGKTGKYKKYLNTLPKFKRELLYRQRDHAKKIARLFRDKAYKVASDQESMAFFQKLIGDYNRYHLEALDYLIRDREEAEEKKRKFMSLG